VAVTVKKWLFPRRIRRWTLQWKHILFSVINKQNFYIVQFCVCFKKVYVFLEKLGGRVAMGNWGYISEYVKIYIIQIGRKGDNCNKPDFYAGLMMALVEIE
jgi:hypothetical protein